MRRQEVHVAAVGLFSPGFGSWAEGQGVLTGETAYRDHGLPPLERVDLPPNEARRITLSVRLALQLAHEALDRAPIPTERLAAVFACSGGNTQALAKILASLGERVVSPNQFAHVGHNAAAGYWSIASARPSPTTSLAAYDGSFAAGLIEAVAQAAIEARPVLLVASDTPPPAALASSRPISAVFGVSLLLSPAASPTGKAPRIALETAVCSQPAEEEDRLADPALEALRTGNPAARSLPLVRLLALGRAGRIVLPHLARRPLVVHHVPC